MKRTWIAGIVGLIVGLIILPLVALIYVEFGFLLVATGAAPMPMEKWAANTALRAQVSRDAPKDSPLPANETNLLAGAKIYREDCSVCHGLPNLPETTIARGMFPPPPQLLKGRGVTDDPVGYTYWKVANGIRLTGMPAFGKSYNDERVWQVSLFLKNSTNLPPAATELLSKPEPASK